MKQRKNWMFGVVLGTVFLILQMPFMALAQDQDQDQGTAQGDPPGRVARLDFSSGSVSFQPGGEGDWVQAVNNRPLTTGDNLWADQNSRAELELGSTSIRMNSETSVTFLDLDDHTAQIKLSQGTLEFRVRHLDDGDTFEIDTPNLAFDVQRTGEYRIDVNANGDQTIATVWSGRGEVTGGGSSYIVIAGQQATFNGTDQLDHEIAQLPGRDDFDNWVLSRDQREDRAESANYISTEMTGYEDLDDNGHWHYVADYGPVWTPAGVAGDWAPYRYGHWVSIEPWGWTWVGDEPWGFAPYHYGRWAFVESSWCWVPGPVVVRPYYAPALVAFIGGGGFNLSVSVGGAGVGWFPLGPREVYVPWYRTSREYVNTVNITNTRVNVTQVTNVYNVYNSRNTNVTRITYVNQHVNNGVTVVPRDAFVNARPVARNIAHVDERQIASAPVTHEVGIQPVRASVMGAGRPASVRPPAAVENRRVVATRNPTPPRGSFEQRQAANVRTVTPGQAQPVAHGAETARPGEPANRNEPARPQEPAANNRPEAAQSNARPEEPARPQQQPAPSANRNVPRPPTGNVNQPNGNRGNEDYRQPSENARASQPTHPLVRTAPPVQERPEQQRNEQQKFNNWQQQRQASAPRPESRPQPQHEERAPQSHGGEKPKH
ncbi:MAG TPA: DUF6600 domain-containing protein [Terriglobales bacterium]|nr:DUF6600 domain-containing protein [Terriglobales bacterium]